MTSTTLKVKRVLTSILVAAVWVGVWQVLASLVGTDLLLPGPLDTFARLGSLAVTADFWSTIAASMARILVGWLIGVFIGAALAALTAMSHAVSAFFSPAMSVIKATPVASFVMLAFVWIRGENLPVFCTVLMVLPLAWANIHEGLLSADRDLIEMARAFKLDRATIFRTIRLPALLPHLFGAIRVSLGFAWKAGVAAEVISHVGRSIGGELYDAKLYLETIDTFAWTAVIILLSVLLEKLCAAAMNRAAVRFGAASGRVVNAK